MGALKYDIALAPGEEGTSHALMLELVGSAKRVLDVGCATGYLATALTAHGCTVDGVEVDPDAAEQARPTLARLVVGDLESLDLVAELGEARYDAVVLGDVLEHLRDPLPVLRGVRPLLRPGGAVVISVPNVAHGALRLSLLRGRWDYRELGLLDDTHLRFFTRANLERLLRDAGFAPVDLRRSQAGLFETELGLSPDEVPEPLLTEVLAAPEALTYQFVVKAVPDDGEHAVWAMHDRLEEMREALRLETATVVRVAEQQAASLVQAEEVRQRLAALQQQLADRDGEVAALTAELEAVHATRTMRATRGARSVYGRLRGV